MTLKKRWLAGTMASVMMMLTMVGSMGVSANETEEESETGWENMTIEEREADLKMYEEIAPFVISPDSDCSVIAATPYDMDAWYGADADNGYQTLVFYTHPYGGTVSNDTVELTKQNVVYCVEPYVTLIESSYTQISSYVGSTNDVVNMTTSAIPNKGDVAKLIGRILSVSRTTATADQILGNPAQLTQYVATQSLIWEVVEGDRNAKFEKVGNGIMEDMLYDTMTYWDKDPEGGHSMKWWRNKIESEVQKAGMISSFAGKDGANAPTVEMYEETMKLTDANGVLSHMAISIDDPSVSYSISGNTLTLKNPNRVDFKVTMTNTLCSNALKPIALLSYDTTDGANTTEKRQTTITVSKQALGENEIGYFNVKMTDGSADVDKVDEKDKNLPGATLQLIDENGNVVDEWVTTDTTHQIQKLVVGKEYTLHEKKAPAGYATADDVKFTVTDTSKPQHVEMIDEIIKVEISKQDITTGNELPGATLQVVDSTGKLIDEWVTSDAPHRIEGLLVGETYTLIEKLPSAGFVTAEEVEFTIVDTPEIQKVVMQDEYSEVEISKQDITTGEELPGATLQVMDESGNVVDEWVSETEPHVITGLVVGKKYTLRETIPAPGYVTAEEIVFTVKDTPDRQKVVMKDEVTTVVFSKKAAGSDEELAGARLQLEDEEGGVIATWESSSEPYTMQKLTAGKTYVLKELVAPMGHVKANDFFFTVSDQPEPQLVELLNEKTKVSITKIDAATGEGLSGAELEIRDEQGNVLAKWTSDGKAHLIEGLPVGMLELVEVKAPKGYELVKKSVIEVKETTEVQEFTLSNELTPVVPDTGDHGNLWIWGLVAMACVGSLVGIVFVERKHLKR